MGATGITALIIQTGLGSRSRGEKGYGEVTGRP